MENTDFRIPRRVLGSLLTSLSAGVVPRSGAAYIAIGRNDEVSALAGDLDRVAEGGGAMRFFVGRYGSGKSFLIQLTRSAAMDRGFVCADCDLSPERRLCGSGGAGLATYRELVRNLSCKAAPDGGALPVIMAKWLSALSTDAAQSGYTPGADTFEKAVTSKIYAACRSLESGVGGFDFAFVISEYYKAYSSDNEDRMSVCLRWLRGEYSNKTEAKEAFGVRTISVIGDDNWYDHIKLLASFVRLAGYKGLAVFIDEGVNLYKIVNRVSREQNYEKILSMYNDSLQGRAEGLMLVMGGTPQFLEDTRRGLFSYDALRSRLADGAFPEAGLKNLMSPVLRLRRLSDSELLALIMRLTLLHAKYYGYEPRIGEEKMQIFLGGELSGAGASEMVTPREIIRDYLMTLDLMYQNPESDFAEILVRTGRERFLGGDNGNRTNLAIAEISTCTGRDDTAKTKDAAEVAEAAEAAELDRMSADRITPDMLEF